MKQSKTGSTYANVRTCKSQNWLEPYGSHLADPAHGETPPPLDISPEVVKTRADAICTGPRSKDVTSKGKRREGRDIPSDTVLHITNSGMSGIRPSNLPLVTRTKSRSLSELDTLISVQIPNHIMSLVLTGQHRWWLPLAAHHHHRRRHHYRLCHRNRQLHRYI